MNSSVCSHCGEKILPHWNFCPVCALPFADAAARPTENSDRDDFYPETTSVLGLACVQCKGVIAPEAQICPHCHVLIVRRYCSGCSRLIPDQSMMCPYCSTPASAKRSRSKIYIQSAAALMILGALVGGLVFVYRVPGDTPKVESPPLLLPVSSGPGLAVKSMADQPRSVAEPAEQNNSETETDEAQQQAGVRESFDDDEEAIESHLDAPLEPSPSQETEPVPAEQSLDTDWQSRGAKLKEGRKLTIRASNLMQQNRYSEASVLLGNAIRMFPPGTKDLSYGEALYKLGICLRRKGHPEQAIPVLRQAMEFPYYRSKVLREVEAATGQLQRTKINQTRG